MTEASKPQPKRPTTNPTDEKLERILDRAINTEPKTFQRPGKEKRG